MFGRNLKHVRQTLGLTQKDLEVKSGIKESAISHFETGKRDPSLKNVIKLCKALGCAPNALISID